MWWRDNYVTIIIGNSSLLIMWLGKASNVFIPKAWAVKSLGLNQINQSIIFNLTHLSEIISDFLQAHKLKNPYVSLAFAENHIWEDCRWHTADEPPHDPAIAQKVIWNYAPLYANYQEQKHFFYLFGLRREILFQYQLLALKVPFHCCTITSKNRALLYMLSFLNQPLADQHIKQIKTVQELASYCNTLCNAYGSDALFEPNAHFSQLFSKEKELILASAGLFLLGTHHELQ